MKNIYFIALLLLSSCSYPVIDSDILVYENSFEYDDLSNIDGGGLSSCS